MTSLYYAQSYMENQAYAQMDLNDAICEAEDEVWAEYGPLDTNKMIEAFCEPDCLNQNDIKNLNNLLDAENFDEFGKYLAYKGKLWWENFVERRAREIVTGE